MTTTPGELERKVRRLDNDVHDIYELLGGISGTQTRHTHRLDELQTMVRDLDVRVTGHDARFDAIDTRFDAVDVRFDAVDTRFDEIEKRLDTLSEGITEVLRRLPG